MFLLIYYTYVMRRNIQREYHGTFKFYYSCTFWFQVVKEICPACLSSPWVNIQCRMAQQKWLEYISQKPIFDLLKCYNPSDDDIIWLFVIIEKILQSSWYSRKIFHLFKWRQCRIIPTTWLLEIHTICCIL